MDIVNSISKITRELSCLRKNVKDLQSSSSSGLDPEFQNNLFDKLDTLVSLLTPIVTIPLSFELSEGVYTQDNILNGKYLNTFTGINSIQILSLSVNSFSLTFEGDASETTTLETIKVQAQGNLSLPNFKLTVLPNKTVTINILLLTN